MARETLKDSLFNTSGDKLEGRAAEEAVSRTLPEEERITMYTIIGKGDYKNDEKNDVLMEADDNNSDVCAKKVERNGKTKFYIKRDARGHFYNPVGLYSTTSKEKKPRQTGEKWTFSEVNKVAFKSYLAFLRTKQARFIHQAESESY